VRFAECNLACDYCDTPYQAGPTCQIESRPGSGEFSSRGNPVNLAEISGLIADWQDSSNHVHHSVALTGGEPLLHADVLRKWLPELSAILPVFLETNGTLAGELEKILPLVEWISMDIKGSAVTGAATPWRDHGDFLALAKDRLCQVKLVVDAATTDAELLEAARLVNRHAPHVPFVRRGTSGCAHYPANPSVAGRRIVFQEADGLSMYRQTLRGACFILIFRQSCTIDFFILTQEAFVCYMSHAVSLSSLFFA
jgi:organic radical activating enzyme